MKIALGVENEALRPAHFREEYLYVSRLIDLIDMIITAYRRAGNV